MYRIMDYHPELKPYENDIKLRMERYEAKLKQLTAKHASLNEFSNAHRYYGIHHDQDGWVYREWAPAADAVYLTGDFCNWHWQDYPLKKLENGNWEVRLPEEKLANGTKVMTVVKNGDKLTQHIPLYAHRVVQDVATRTWCAEVVDNKTPYAWTDQNFKSDAPMLIYEAHVGMCSEEERVASYRDFADVILPHVVDAGYNTIQLMAIMEHPYYGSFGYQVSNFFAASSRFGLPEDLKYLVNKAHSLGIRVLLDLVHSHAVKNTAEGINLFDGTDYQFFHAGAEGEHPAWGTKCFDYNKPEVIHFLLSNLKYWLEEYHFDGFRFDGVTSMLYHDHGLGTNFTMSSYFTMNTDLESVTYLQLANKLIREVNPNAITIAEDMSGMPGMCDPIEDGGIGFSYRLAMGEPDMWIKLVKTTKDEDWNVENIWSNLVFRNTPTIGYVESHDQALVGDQTMMFRLAGASMYTDMSNEIHNPVIDRAIALHKMLRLITLSAGGDGYLAFMGNEFGHPEWIDFPREGNGWSHYYCRRQWSLMTNGFLKYRYLYQFDKDMIAAAKANNMFVKAWPDLRLVHVSDHVLAYERGDLLFVFNFHPTKSFEGYTIPVGKGVDYEVLFSSDDFCYGGFGRINRMTYTACIPDVSGNNIRMYLPSRTCVVLRAKTEMQVQAKPTEKASTKQDKAPKKTAKTTTTKTE